LLGRIFLIVLSTKKNKMSNMSKQKIPAGLQKLLAGDLPPPVEAMSKTNPFSTQEGAPMLPDDRPSQRVKLENEPSLGQELGIEAEAQPAQGNNEAEQEISEPDFGEIEKPKSEEKGNKIPQEFWNMKHCMEGAEGKAEALEKALKQKGEQAPSPTPQKQPEGEQKPNKLPGHVVVLFPCMKTTNPILSSILFWLGKTYGDQISIVLRMGDSMIYHSRNVLADTFTEKFPHAEYCLWIDDDMIPPIGNAQFIREQTGVTPQEMPDRLLNVNFLERLISHKKTLVGGCYFGRRKVSPAMFKEGIDDVQAYKAAKEGWDEIRPTEWVATGLMLAHKSVFKDIRATFPNLAPTPKRAFWDYFRPDDGGGEDVMFCHRAKAAGHQPYVDTGCQALHIGAVAYSGYNTENPMLEGKNNPDVWWK
jgi:broad specificity phosphatase PhoE